MDRIANYLQVVPIWLILALAIGGVIAALAIPRQYRLSASLIFMVVWLTLNRFPDLGMIQAISKTTSLAAYALVGIAAVISSGPKRRLSFPVWMFPILAIFAFFFILRVQDLTIAMVLRLQWLVLTLSALMLVRTIVDTESLLRVLRGLALGGLLACAIPMAGLILDPAAMFKGGWGRLSPFGANSNQIGVLFAFTAPLALYFALADKRRWRPFWLAGGIMACVLAVLTASRSSLLAIAVPCLPLAFAYFRRPIAVLGGLTVALIIIPYIMSLGGDAEFTRLGSLETSRPQIWAQYIGVIADRPLFGLLQQPGLSIHAESAIGAHPHNAYLEMLYMGGLVFALPSLALVALTIVSTLRVFSYRSMFFDPLLAKQLCAQMLIMLLHGFVNGAIYYPTYSWSFYYVVLSMVFLSWAGELRSAPLRSTQERTPTPAVAA